MSSPKFTEVQSDQVLKLIVPKYLAAARDPFLTVDWRWRRAERLHQDHRKPGDYDDDLVHAAYELQRDTREGAPLTRRRRALQTDLGRALLLHKESGVQRDELEARLLAGEGDQTIGGKTGVKPGVVLAFHAVFFDVRARLNASDWILIGALAGDRDGSPEGALWRWAGWTGGPVLVDLLVADFRHRWWDHWPDHPQIAAGIRTLMTFSCTPMADPGFLVSLRQLEDLAVARAEDVSAQTLAVLAAQVRYLERMAKSLQKKPRSPRNRRSRVGKAAFGVKERTTLSSIAERVLNGTVIQ